MRNLSSRSIVSALGGHPPNTQLLDIAHGLSGTASRENIAKAIAGAQAHKVKVLWPSVGMNIAPARTTSFSKLMSPRPANTLSSIFRAPNPMRGAGYFAPRGMPYAVPVLRAA